MGRKIIDGKLSENSTAVDLSVPNGMYFVKVHVNNSSETTKIVVSN